MAGMFNKLQYIIIVIKYIFFYILMQIWHNALLYCIIFKYKSNSVIGAQKPERKVVPLSYTDIDYIFHF